MDDFTPHKDNEDGTVRIGMREIYDVLVVLRDDVGQIGMASRAAIEDVADHEERLRSLERWKYGLPIGAVAAIVPGIIALLR